MEKIIKELSESSSRGADRIKELKAFRNMEVTMNDELTRFEKLINDDQDIISRRAYVRAVYAYVEGMIWLYKQNFLHFDRVLFSLSAAEHNALNDIEFAVKENGKISQRSAKISLLTNLRFVFAIYKEYIDKGLHLDTDGDDFAAFKDGINIRDQITHPKEFRHLDITVDEVEKVERGLVWFKRNIKALTACLITATNESSRKKRAVPK
jgi:hypothetical protein